MLQKADLDEAFVRIRSSLAFDEPLSKGLRLAAVSMIIRDRNLPSVLLIKRAERVEDPWSGQIAFPGCKAQPEDKTARDTAVRETREEVGIDLDSEGWFLGYGAVSTTHTGTMDVVPSVFELQGEVNVTPNGEVSSYRWVGLKDLLSPASRSTYRFERQGEVVQLPAYKVGDYVVWGLTHRIISSMLRDR